MKTVLLDTHVVHWWSSEPDRLSKRAREVVDAADELAVASIAWYELAWLAHNERIALTSSVRAWLHELGRDVRTVAITPAIAVTAAELPSSFPGDPADRLICASAIETGWPLVSKDRRIRGHRTMSGLTCW